MSSFQFIPFDQPSCFRPKVDDEENVAVEEPQADVIGEEKEATPASSSGQKANGKAKKKERGLFPFI